MLDDKFWKKYFAVYDVLNDLIPYQELLNTIVEKLEIAPTDLVLDAGSGTGNLALRIEELGARVVGIDMSEAGVDLHKKKIPNADVRVGDLTEPLPFPDEHFDKICSNNVIYTLPPEKRAAVFAEFYRVLKPGGMVAVVNPKHDSRIYKIYTEGVYERVRRDSFVKGFLEVVSLIPSTIKMFFYNRKILEGRDSHFPSHEETRQLLINSGFDADLKSESVYAKQNLLFLGIK